MCSWPKCEPIEGSTDYSFKTQFLQFIWIANKQNPLKNIYIFHILAVKIVK